MDKAIFEFSCRYSPKDIEKLTRKDCERLCNTDESNVTKYDLETESLETLLNASVFEESRHYLYRVFIDEYESEEEEEKPRMVEVDWDTDGEEIPDLPKIVEIPKDWTDEEISDNLSDEFGFCVYSWMEIND